MSEENSKPVDDEDLDELLSMRGKPLRTGKRNENICVKNGGIQGRQIEAEPAETDQNKNEENKFMNWEAFGNFEDILLLSQRTRSG